MEEYIIIDDLKHTINRNIKCIQVLQARCQKLIQANTELLTKSYTLDENLRRQKFTYNSLKINYLRLFEEEKGKKKKKKGKKRKR